jgi:acyl-CoA oxidase
MDGRGGAAWCGAAPPKASARVLLGPHVCALARAVEKQSDRFGSRACVHHAWSLVLLSVANDLDNACVSFKCWAPRSALLSRFAEVRDNKYVQTTDQRMRIEILGQRLLTGRLAIAQAAVVFAQRLFQMTKEYADKKTCWAPKGLPQPKLSEIPHIAAIFAEGGAKLAAIEKYNFAVEKKLNRVLVSRVVPDAEMVECIAVAKIKSVAEAITLTNMLSREVGSYALMHAAGFGATHWLLMCAFAEGDGRVLSQKLARDSMKHFKQSSWAEAGKEAVFGSSAEQAELKARFMLSRALAQGASPADANRLWNENYQLVYELSDAVCAKYVAKYAGEEARHAVFAKL